jgi:NtrC-family two-component system sensor histidine kinase KinB
MSVLSENNETSWYKIQAVPLKSGGDNIYGATFFARNIDSEKIIQEERESYIATLTHDLKTPAIAQVRALEMLLSGRFGEFNDSQKELLSLTLDSCNYLYGMVRTLLNTCDFNNGKLSLTYSQTDIKDLLKECVREISSLAQNKSVDFKFDFPAKLLIINADAFELKQVILNFLSNIVNFAFQNSTLKISLKECGKTFEIEFCASSPYLSMEELNNLFKKHITHSGKLNKVGLGLGFYRSKKIIEAHGGKVIAKSLEQDVFCLGFILPQKIKSKGISLLPV